MNLPLDDAEASPLVEQSGGRLAGLLAHQLGAGVAVIEACASMLRDADDAPDVVRALEAVGERLRRVDEDLHDLARIARRRPSPACVRVGDSLAVAREEFAAHESRAVVGVSVSSGELPRVYADQTHLERLFVHLLHAVATCGAMAITVAAREQAGEALFLVADDRAMVTRGDIASLLDEPRAPRRLRVVGTSVGLEVCRAIVEWHDGRIGMHYDRDGRLAVAFSLATVRHAPDGA